MIVTALPSYAMAESSTEETALESIVEGSDEQSLTEEISEEENTVALSEDETLSDDVTTEENSEEVTEAVTETLTEEQEMVGEEEQIRVFMGLEGCSVDKSSLQHLTATDDDEVFYIHNEDGKTVSSISFSVIPQPGYVFDGISVNDNSEDEISISRDSDTFTVSVTDDSLSGINRGFNNTLYINISYIDTSSCRKITFVYDHDQVYVPVLQDKEEDYLWIKSGDDLIFDARARSGYQIDSVKEGEEDLARANDNYVIGNGSGDVTITITSSPKRSPVTFKVDGETYNSATSHASFNVEGLTEDNKTDGQAIVINTNPEDGYEISKVTYAVIRLINGEAVLTSENKYTIAADVVAKLADTYGSIEINITTKSNNIKTLKVDYTAAHINSVSAIADGSNIEDLSTTEGKAEYKVKKGTKLTLRPVIKDRYEITGIRPEGLDADFAENGDIVLTVNENTSVEIISEGIPTLYYKSESGSDPLAEISSGGTVSFGCDDGAYIFQMNEGSSEDKKLKIESAVAKIGKNAADAGFIEIVDSDNTVKINPSVIAGKTAKVTVTGKNESDKPFTKTFNVSVASKITSVALSGFKKGSKKTEQLAGSSADYTITLNKGADLSSIHPVLKDSGSNADIIYDPDNKKMTVRMYKKNLSDRIKIATSPVEVDFKDIKTGDIIDTYTFDPVKKQFAAPTVKVTGANDLGMCLTMDVPKELKNCENLIFKIDATASTGKAAEGMLDSIKTIYAPYSPGSENTVARPRFASSEIEPGNGTAQKYDISVSVIQVLVGGEGYEETNIYNESSVKKLLNQSTKNPCYETKLGLIKKNTSVIIGRTDVTLATAKYTAKTTFTKISRAILTDSKGNIVGESGSGKELILTGDDVLLSHWSDKMCKPGKYTLYVYPEKKDYAHCTPASMTVTFKPAVTDIKLTAASSKIYKQDKKAASIKIKASVESVYDSVSYKPANGKLTWTVSSDNPDLQKAASIKKGTLIIDKNYVLSLNPDYNKVFVAVSAKDGSGIKSILSFVVTNTVMQPDSVFIGDTEGVISNPEPLISTAFDGKYMIIQNDKGENLSLSNMTITVTPKTGMTVANDGTVKVTKPGTYTVKAVANDGGKKSIVRKFAVKYADITGYDLSVKTGLINTVKSSKTELAATNGSTIDPGSVIYVEIAAKTDNEGALVSNTGSVILKNAKLIKIHEAEEGQFYIRPTSYPCEVTVSSKDGKLAEKKYSFTLKELPVKLTADKKQYSFVIKETKELGQFTFSTENFVIDSSKKYVLYFNPVDKDLADKNKLEKTSAAVMCIMMGMTTKGEYIPDNKDTSKGTFVFKPYYALSDIYPGTYSLQVQLFEYDIEGEGIAISNPVQIKVKFTEAPAPKVALKKTVTVSSSADATVLPYKNCKNLYGVTGVNIYNDLIKGVPNDFAEYFIADMTQDAKNIVLRRSAKPIPADLKQITGWIGYTALGKDGKSFTKEEKITVKFTSSEKKGVPVYFAVDEMPEGVSVAVSDVKGVVKKTGLTEGKEISFALKKNTKFNEIFIVTYQYDLGDIPLSLEYNADTGRYTVPVSAVSGAENYKGFLYIRVSINDK